MTTAPNTCRADTDKTYMSWDQINQLKNNYGWEIGSHTVDHYCLASIGDGSDCQTNQLTSAEVSYELSQSKADLAAHGIDAKALATPYGDYNNATLPQIAKYYTSQRGFADTGYNSWPYSDYLLRVQQVQGRVSVATVKSYIDSAIQNKQWLILVFHDVKATASNKNDDYEYATSKLDQIAAYVKTKRTAGLLQSVNVSNGLVSNSINLLPNSSFNSGIGDGWRTDSPATITADSSDNGNIPDSINSVKLTSATSNKHLFSPLVSVNSSLTYVLKNYLSVRALSTGEVAFYIDEYDANSNWISGQYKSAERSAFTESLNFSYRPTSASVKKASLQVIVTGGSGITAYLDNCQWFATP
jgi:hypothetical protein